MRLVHSLVVTPGRCGLYETARDLIRAEITTGHMAVAIEPEGHSKGMVYDADIPVALPKQKAGFLADADVIVDHSGCDAEMLASGLPIIHVRHGRPLSTFLMSRKGKDVWTHVARLGKDERYRAFVTFWPDHQRYWEALTGKPCHVLPAPVDITKYTPDGPLHQFKRPGSPNVVCADMFREDETPFELIFKFKEWAGRWEHETPRIHVYGMRSIDKPTQTLLGVLGDNLGDVGWSDDMASVYRACDWVWTGSRIATRAVREASACGKMVYRNGKDRVTSRPREWAENNHAPHMAAAKLIEVAESVLGATVGS